MRPLSLSSAFFLLHVSCAGQPQSSVSALQQTAAESAPFDQVHALTEAEQQRLFSQVRAFKLSAIIALGDSIAGLTGGHTFGDLEQRLGLNPQQLSRAAYQHGVALLSNASAAEGTVQFELVSVYKPVDDGPNGPCTTTNQMLADQYDALATNIAAALTNLDNLPRQSGDITVFFSDAPVTLHPGFNSVDIAGTKLKLLMAKRVLRGTVVRRSNSVPVTTQVVEPQLINLGSEGSKPTIGGALAPNVSPTYTSDCYQRSTVPAEPKNFDFDLPFEPS